MRKMYYFARCKHVNNISSDSFFVVILFLMENGSVININFDNNCGTKRELTSTLRITIDGQLVKISFMWKTDNF